MFHGVHHAQPQSKSRLVMPPALSIPLAFLFYGIFYLVIVVVLRIPGWFNPVFAGFAAGYLSYDILHYSMHHFRVKTGYLSFIRKYHWRHHVQTPELRFGVTSPLWDIVFGTRPKEWP
jgi:sterol desaturase/sphingolipid hydroxylase (fatty acid hydroxylase superfamily)